MRNESTSVVLLPSEKPFEQGMRPEAIGRHSDSVASAGSAAQGASGIESIDFDTSALKNSGFQSLVLSVASLHLSIRGSAQFELCKLIWRGLHSLITVTECGAGLDPRKVDMGQHQRKVTPFAGG